jgi:hypothetical protein
VLKYVEVATKQSDESEGVRKNPKFELRIPWLRIPMIAAITWLLVVRINIPRQIPQGSFHKF